MDKERVIRSNSKFRLYLTVFTFLALAILIFSLREQIADVIRNLGKVHAWALLLIIPIEAINYDAYARLYRSLFKTLGTDVKYSSLLKVQLELNFVNHILPSGGVSGISYFSLRLKSEDVSPTKSTFVQVMKFMLLYISYLPILVLGLLALAVRGHSNNLVLVITSSIITAIIIGTFALVYIIGSRTRINSFLTWFTKIINRVVHIIRPNRPDIIEMEGAQRAFSELHDNYKLIKQNWGQLQKPLFFTTVANLTELAAIYVVYIAFGEFVNFGAVILSYAVANFAGLISVLPAGVGVFEALMTTILAATGIPASLSIPVTIMYRVCSTTVQLIPGYFFYQKAVKEGITTKS
jgi:uncharacterized protein (TIRG00374 family)